MKEFARKQIEEIYEIGMDIRKAESRKPGYSDGIKKILTGLYPDDVHFIFELFQNAEDKGATQVKFSLSSDELIFVHNGPELFDFDNINSITNIGDSTKLNDDTKIGQFGVGFKSVFAYTETPRIYSGDYWFEIRDLICPYPLSQTISTYEETKFEFPFNNKRKSAQQSMSEISTGLQSLSDNTLLFLNNIKKIEYMLPDGDTGSLERIDHDNDRIEIRTCHPDGSNSASHWLRIQNEVEVTDEDGKNKNCRIAIAYCMEAIEDKKKKGTSWEIIPLEQGQVSVYFPAVDEKPNLRFHMHAPFATPVARSSVKKELTANQALRDHLAQLVVESLLKIRSMGMLTVEFLSVLPNTNELTSFYLPIQTAIINAFQNHHLTPTRSKTHATSVSLYRGPSEVADGLGDDGLSVFTGKAPPLWAANPPALHHRSRGFLDTLKISEWGWSKLTENLHSISFPAYDKVSKPKQARIENWISNLKDAKLLELYALLGEAYNFKRAGYSPPYSELKIIRISSEQGDEHVKANDVYLQPVEGISTLSSIRYVKPEVYSKGRSEEQKRHAKLFLEHIGICPFDEKQAILKKMERYVSPPGKVPKSYLEDIAQFVDLFLNHPSECGKLKEIPFLRGTSPDGAVHWRKPFELYLDQPYLDTGLDGLFNDKSIVLEKNKERILDDYRDIPKFSDFAVEVGVMAGLEIRNSSATHIQKDKFKIPDVKTTSNTVDDDFYINGLHYQDDIPAKSPYFLGQLKIDVISVSYVIWKTMSRAEPKQLIASYIPNAANRHKEKTDSSFIVNYLRENKWIPDKNNIFRKPADISKEELHLEFSPDDRNGWLTAIGLGQNLIKQSEEYREKNRQARREGFRTLELKEQLARFSRERSPEEIERFLAEHKVIEQPEASVSKPDRLRNKMLERKGDAAFIERVTRERTVQLRLSPDKQAAKAYLRDLYKNAYGELACQCCRKEMPFKHKDSDLHYFEAVQFVKNPEKRHKENYLALCPTCSAMYSHFRETDDTTLKRNLIECKSPDDAQYVEIPVILVGKELSLRFVGTHWFELKTILGTGKV